MKTRYKHIYFESRSEKRPIFWCRDDKSGDKLGMIEFYKPWEQFCFFPEDGEFFNDQCLRDIIHFMGQLKKEES